MNLFEAKRKFRTLYMITFDDGNAVTFHLLSWGEFKQYRDILTTRPNLEVLAKDDIFKQCVVDMTFPYSVDGNGNLLFSDYLDAGVADTIGNIILRMSGAFDADQLFGDIDSKRSYAMSDSEKRILSTICTVSKYKLEDFDGMYWEEIVDIIAQNELLLSGILPELPFMQAKEKSNKIDFEKENMDDQDSNNSTPDITELKRQRTRELRKQMGIR